MYDRYPTVSTTIFTMFACRELDSGQSFHVYDAHIDCTGGTYKIMRIVAVVALLLLPIGIPTAFAVLLYKNRDLLNPPLECALKFEAFENMVHQVAPEVRMERRQVRMLFNSIDQDGSKAVELKELVQYAVAKTPEVSSYWTTVRKWHRSEKSVRLFQSDRKAKWWRLGPEGLKFLCKAFEPGVFCPHPFLEAMLGIHSCSCPTCNLTLLTYEVVCLLCEKNSSGSKSSTTWYVLPALLLRIHSCSCPDMPCDIACI